jgi:tryptophan-rich sensory protein
MFWSFLFFLRHRPDWAFTETALLWLSIGMMIAMVAPLSSLGAALLLPYLLWVSLAWALTRAVVRLNGPFAA